MQTKRYHHVFDLTNCNKNIGSRETVRKFIEEIVKTIDMKILEGPIIAQGSPSNPGISALAIIDFSHISIHAFSKYKEALIDIFSCKEYDKDLVRELCKKYFSTNKTKIREKEVWWG
jgi:S-adenosylmethionine decarboxylase